MIKIGYRIVMLAAGTFFLTTGADAQVAAVKSNLLYGGATQTPNIGVELPLGKNTTLDIWGGYNPWNLNGSEVNNEKAVHWILSPEFRYWPCKKFSQHFFGAHLIGSMYNVGGKDVPFLFEKKYRYEGSAIGGGISYGYHWAISKSWGAEFELGLGAAHLSYTKYDCPKCGSKVGHEQKTYLGPTRANISIVYLFYKHEH